MEALSDFANYLTRGVQRRVEMMVAYKVEAKLDRYIPDGFSYTDAVKMQIAIYIAKGLVAPYFPPEDAEQEAQEAAEEARKAEEEARKRLEEEKRRQQEEGQESSGFWSLFSWDDGEEEEEEQKKEEKKEAESYLMSFFHKKVEEKSEAAQAGAERIVVARYAQKKAEAEDSAKEEEEEQGGPPIVSLIPARSALALSGPARTVSRCPAATRTACPPRTSRPARRALLLRAPRPAAACTSRPAALRVAPCCSQRVAPYCSQRVALCCPARRALLPCASRSAALRVAPYCSPRIALCCPARRALLQPARRALLQPARRALLALASRPAAASAARPTAATPPSHPAATTAAASGGAAGSAGSAAGAGGAGGAIGSARGAAGAERATESAGGAAGAGGAGPTTDRHCLSWPLSRQLQRLGVDSGGHCLSRMTPPLSSFASGFFSEPVQVVEALVFYAVALGASESAAPLGANESAAALGISESAVALGARASPATGPSSAEALHTFTLDSGASRCFFRDCTTLTPLAAPVPVSLADPSGGPVVARASTVLPCPAVPSGSLSGLHLPTFSTNLVSNAAIQDVWVDTFIPGGQRVAICQVVALSQVSASGQLAASCSCRVLSHQTLLWHHRLGHPSLPRLRGMHSRLLVSGLPRSLPSLLRSPAPPCLPCVEGRQRAAPHSSEFPPITVPLQTLHMDVWGPAPVGGTDHERYFQLVVDDYTRYTTVFPLRRKADVSGVLIPWIRATRRQLRERFSRDFPVLSLHSDRGGEFSSDLLAEFCQDKGIVQSFMVPASPQQSGIAERRIGLIIDVACTSMIHAAAPHFLWSFAVRYAAHQLNLWPRVSELETLPTLWWTRKVGDASMFRVWGTLFLVRDAKASKLSSRTLRCVFLGFPTDAPTWQLYHPRSRRGPAPSGVSQVDPPPLVEHLEVTSDSSGPAEGGDPTADDTAAIRRSPRLESPPGFQPRPSALPLQPAVVDSGAETAGAEPGGAETEGEGSGGARTGGAATGGAVSGGAATGGAGSWGAATGATAA
ncbi:unnamed protein product [Closterium sp. NIES-53]